MKISILGTGIVGQTLAARLVELEHEVFMGTRDRKRSLERTDPLPMTGRTLKDWISEKQAVELVSFEDLPGDTELFINATPGEVSFDALSRVGKMKLKDRVILDVANPLDFTKGMPPALTICNVDSLAERIQSEFPDSRVVKGLNTMNAKVMVNPESIHGEHNVFLSGNNGDAKKLVASLLNEMGWTDRKIIDLGDITTARGTEMLLPLWLRLYGAFGNADFNFHIARAQSS